MPVKEYLSMLKVSWDIDEYKQTLPEIMKAFTISDFVGVHFTKSQ